MACSSLRDSTLSGQKNRAAALDGEADQDVLLEGIVGPALWRPADEVAAPFVLGPGIAVPLLMEYGGLARITSNWRWRSSSMC
jgi:hypothetical protein